ncbi:hypothetical protein [Modestobacter sp. SYSU DS0875]
MLTRQERQPLEAHVTVQDEVEPSIARALHAQLAAAFAPEAVRARGLGLWHHRGGPWEPDSAFPFRAGG